MSFETVHRVGVYLLLFLSALILNIDSDAEVILGGAPFHYPMVFPLLMISACIGAAITVDRDPARGLSPQAASFLALGSMVLVYVEFRNDENQLVLACGHSLFYLALVKLFRPKAPADDWYLILLALMQVLVGCFLSQSDRVGLLLLLWAVLALVVLSLFYLHREALQAPLPKALLADPYRGLMSPAFVFATLRWTLLTLLCGGFIFLVMPRAPGQARGPRESGQGRSITGFTDETRLGQMGEILENEQVVMSVEVFDDDGRKYIPEDDLLWRGVVLNRYESGRWSRGPSSNNFEPVIPQRAAAAAAAAGAPIVKQRIYLENLRDPTLFLLRPFLEVEAPGNTVAVMSAADGTVSRETNQGRRIRNGGPIEYSVRSLRDQREGGILGLHSQPGETYRPTFLDNESGDPLLRVPAEILDRFRALALPVVADIPEDDLVARARALESFLRDSGTYKYDLSQSRSDPDLDPILDFLLNTRSGHCEYFASGLAMLLRSVGIPCRLVHGFKGGDWNDLARIITVRQKHAHAWVEACVDTNSSPPVWLTLDPSPDAPLDGNTGLAASVPGGVRQFSDLVRYIWVFYIAGFNSERQQQLIYGPALNLMAEARNGFRIMGAALVRLWEWLTDFPSFSSFFSIRGFVASFATMLLLVGLFRILLWAWTRMARRLRGSRDLVDDPSGALAVYARLIRTLADRGLERPRGETPREFARRAALYLADRPEAGLPVSQIPALVVDAFYRVRYGGLELAPEHVHDLERHVDALESNLNANPS